MNDLLAYDRALGTGQGLLRPARQAERLRSFPGEAGYGIVVATTVEGVAERGEGEGDGQVHPFPPADRPPHSPGVPSM